MNEIKFDLNWRGYSSRRLVSNTCELDFRIAYVSTPLNLVYKYIEGVELKTRIKIIFELEHGPEPNSNHFTTLLLRYYNSDSEQCEIELDIDR